MFFIAFLRFKKYFILLKCLNWFCLAVIWRYFATLWTPNLLLKILTFEKILLLKVYLAVEKIFKRKVNFNFFFSLCRHEKPSFAEPINKSCLSCWNRRKCIYILLKSTFLLVIMMLVMVVRGQLSCCRAMEIVKSWTKSRSTLP